MITIIRFKVLCISQEGRSVTCLSGTCVERLDYDATFWDKAYTRLHKFYHEYLLPELANPCYPRGQQIRHLRTQTQ